MSNYQIRIDLLKLKNAGLARVKGGSGVPKQCLVIPIEDARLFLGSKGCYLDLNAWEGREPGQYGDTHGLKQSLAKATLDQMTEEERKAMPFLGNMKPREAQQAQPMNVTATATLADGDPNELPF